MSKRIACLTPRPYTNAEKRLIVRKALTTGTAHQESGRAIAARLGVSHAFVQKVRDDLRSDRKSGVRVDDFLIGLDGKRYRRKR